MNHLDKGTVLTPTLLREQCAAAASACQTTSPEHTKLGALLLHFTKETHYPVLLSPGYETRKCCPLSTS